MATDELADLLAVELSTVPPPHWPHKCTVCGCFVPQKGLRGKADHEGEYWATADCTRCKRRMNANPI